MLEAEPEAADDDGHDPHAGWVEAPNRTWFGKPKTLPLISGSRIQLLATTMERPKMSPFSHAMPPGTQL